MSASIKPESELVIIGSCGTIVSDIPIAVSEKKKIKDIWYWDYGANDWIKDIIY